MARSDPPSQPIPPELFSEYEERPFQHCTRCGESLTDFPGGFQISKAYKKGECVLEYALCDHCRVSMMDEFSDESKQRLAGFQNEQVQMDHGLTHCAVCSACRDEGPLREFVITGLCEGDALHHGLMLCGDCGDAVQELISSQTRDTWRRFVDDNFPGPPPEDSLPLPQEEPAPAVAATGTLI